jgi:hypothetical protein
MERLEKEKWMHILDQAISTLTNAVEFALDDHPNRGPAFYNLGSALLQCFKVKGSVNDLHSSTTALAQGRNFTPEEGDDYAKLAQKNSRDMRTKVEQRRFLSLRHATSVVGNLFLSK